METMGFITTIITRVNKLVVIDMAYKSWSAFTSDWRVAVTLMLTIMILIYGIQLMVTPRGFDFGRAAKNLIIGLFAWALVTNWSLFSMVIVQPLIKIPEEFVAVATRAVTQNPNASSYSGLDDLWTHCLANVQLLMSQVGWSGAGVGFLLMAGVYLVFAVISIGLATGIVIVVKVVLSLSVFIAPVVLPFMVFPVTRGITLKWLQFTVGLGWAQVVVGITLLFLMAIVEAMSLGKDLPQGDMPLTFATAAADLLVLITAVFCFILSFGIGLSLGAGVGPATTARFDRIITRVMTVNMVKN